MSQQTTPSTRPEAPSVTRENLRLLDDLIADSIRYLASDGASFDRVEVVNPVLLYAWLHVALLDQQTFAVCAAVCSALPGADIELVHAGAATMPWAERGLTPEEIVRRMAATIMILRIMEQPMFQEPAHSPVEAYTYLGCMANLGTLDQTVDLWAANDGTKVMAVFDSERVEQGFLRDSNRSVYLEEAWRRHNRRAATPARGA